MMKTMEHEEDGDIEQVLWSASQIQERVVELGRAISLDLASSSPLVVIGVATGAFMFLADLVRAISLPIVVDIIRAQSYGSGTESNGEVAVSGDLKVDVKGKCVLLVEDIVDTGATIARLVEYLISKGASSVSVCTFLDKAACRVVPLQLSDGKYYSGFECPDSFVVGYGMDFAERYRSLPYLGVLRPSMYKNMAEV